MVNRSAFACSCSPSTEEEQYKCADTVFVGKIAGIEPTLEEILSGSVVMDKDFRINFSIEEWIKGRGPSEVTVFSGPGAGDCGMGLSFAYSVGQRFLVATHIHVPPTEKSYYTWSEGKVTSVEPTPAPSRIRVSRCGLTRKLDDAVRSNNLLNKLRSLQGQHNKPPLDGVRPPNEVK